MKESRRLVISEDTQVGEARRRAVAFARMMGLSETKTSNVGIIVTELASNLVKHARQGEIILNQIPYHDSVGIEILSLNRKAGMANVAECLRDGYSTAGSPGTGLGAIKRLSDEFDIHSSPELGTAVLARIFSEGSVRTKHPLKVGAVSLAKANETVCGDGWEFEESKERSILMVADGLGHGPLAAEASKEALLSFHEHHNESPASIVHSTNLSLKKTRGAAVAVASIDQRAQFIFFSGLGNIGATVVFTPEKSKSFASQNGTAGAQAKRIQEHKIDWSPKALLIMYSDGLVGHWKLEKYPGLINKDPSLIAGILYRDFNRGTDDITVVVAKGH
jgi:anti-sigma regulatory factor (Ser/Thr protein kinase)